MKIIEGKEAEYEKYVKTNSEDPYSKCVVDCGTAFGDALDAGKSPSEAEEAMLATEDGKELTGFMVGAIMSSISHFHPRGAEIKEWWNKSHSGTPDEQTGVNNPAIITLG